MEPRTPRRLVLDHLEPIQVDADRPPIANLHGLSYLPHGLHWLASGVRSDEIAKAEEFSPPLFSEWTFKMSDPSVAMRANAFCWSRCPWSVTSGR